jgi:hypothetical protein
VKDKDPLLAALLNEVYGDGSWRYVKTTAKNADGSPMRSKENLAHLTGLDALRAGIPAFNFNNSPRIIAQAQQGGARGGRGTQGAPAPGGGGR